MFLPNEFAQGIMSGLQAPPASPSVPVSPVSAPQVGGFPIPDLPPSYFSDPDSSSYINPYYVGPQTGGYSRFDTSQVGSGLTNLANPAAAFDAIGHEFWHCPFPEFH